MTLQTLASIDLYSLAKRDLKALCKAIMNADATRKIDLRSNNQAMREFIEDYKLTLTPPLIKQLQETTTESEVTVPKNEEITTVTEEAPAAEETVEPTDNVKADTYTNMDIPTSPALEYSSISYLLEFCLRYSESEAMIDAYATVLEDNPNLLTVDGLSRLLEDYRWISSGLEPRTYPSLKQPAVALGLAGMAPYHQDTLRRVIADPQGWTIGTTPEVQQGMNFYGKLGQIFKPEDLQGIFVYHRVRDVVNELQQFIGASSIRTKSKIIRSEIISYYDKEDQMTMIAGDKEILKKSVKSIVEQYLMLIKKAPKYDLVRLANDEEELPTSYAQILEYAEGACYAWIGTESIDWKPNATNDGWSGGFIERPEPDKISLHLAMTWKGDQAEDYITFEASHSDKSRFPWLALKHS